MVKNLKGQYPAMVYELKTHLLHLGLEFDHYKNREPETTSFTTSGGFKSMRYKGSPESRCKAKLCISCMWGATFFFFVAFLA